MTGPGSGRWTVDVDGEATFGTISGRPPPRPGPALAVVALAAAAALSGPAPPLTGPDPRLLAGPAPAARAETATAVDPRDGGLVLFGGSSVSGAGADLGDTWTRSAAGWVRWRPAASPSPRFDAVMAADPVAETVLLVGGRRRDGPGTEVLDDTWRWDRDGWTRVPTPASPPPGDAVRALAYAAATRTLVLVTDGGPTPRTWTWGAGGWTVHPGAGTPAMRWMAPAADGSVIAVGPPDAANRGETWRWDGDRWQRLAPATAVRVEALSALLAYDPGSRRTLLVEVEFNGVDGAPSGGTWAWDGNTWTEHHSVPAVIGAFGITAPVVAAERPLTLLGGPQDRGAYRDAWVWDGSAWRRS